MIPTQNSPGPYTDPYMMNDPMMQRRLPRLAPGPGPSLQSDSGHSQSTSTGNTRSSRKPRGQGVVVRQACQACRRRKSKCSGTIPCLQCSAGRRECVFDEKKTILARKIEQIRQHHCALGTIRDALRNSDDATLRDIQRLARKSHSEESFLHKILSISKLLQTSSISAGCCSPDNLAPHHVHNNHDQRKYSIASTAAGSEFDMLENPGLVVEDHSSSDAEGLLSDSEMDPLEVSIPALPLNNGLDQLSCSNNSGAQMLQLDPDVSAWPSSCNTSFSSAIGSNGQPHYYAASDMSGASQELLDVQSPGGTAVPDCSVFSDAGSRRPSIQSNYSAHSVVVPTPGGSFSLDHQSAAAGYLATLPDQGMSTQGAYPYIIGGHPFGGYFIPQDAARLY